MIDAVYWVELMYQGVHEDQENYREFRRKSQEERERKHDKIRSDQEKWEDPWMFQFHSASEEIDLERPKPGKKHKYS